MAKFGNKEKPQPGISTASLPDIVFMLLFFFMVSTVMRETDLLVDVTIPQATQLEKLQNKSLVKYLYIGKPTDKQFGDQPLIQANDVFIKSSDIAQFVESERATMDESQRDKIIMSLKVDRDAKMGIVNDVKLELREVDARKINYASVPSAQSYE